MVSNGYVQAIKEQYYLNIYGSNALGTIRNLYFIKPILIVRPIKKWINRLFNKAINFHTQVIVAGSALFL